MQFSQEFIDAVVRKTREKVEYNRKSATSQKQGIINQKTAFEAKRNKLEDRLLDGTIDRHTYKRKHEEIESKIQNFNEQIQSIEDQCRIDMNLIEEVLAFTRNIYKTHLEAPPFLKRHYLRFFYEKIMVKEKIIYETVPTPIFLTLRANRLVIIRKSGLGRWDDFRTANWLEIVEYPEIVMQQTQQLLTL